MPLEAGDPAPDVSAPNQDGEPTTLPTDGPTVVYFYPRDGTSGCTTEARQFQAELDSYRETGVAIYGVSTDSVDSHRDFCDDQGLEFDLLADPDAELAEAFGVDASNGAASRTTVVLLDDEVWRVYEDVSPDGHAREVLGDLLDAGVVNLPE
jgi:peroxiredoxin Q/BCP